MQFGNSRQTEEIYGRKKLLTDYTGRTDKGDQWQMYLGDCVDVTKALAPESVGLSIFSPPFSNLYIYSDSIRDMGNSASDEEFLASFKFLFQNYSGSQSPEGFGRPL